MAIVVMLKHKNMVSDYELKKLNNAKLIYLVYEKKILATVHALKVCRHYLLGIEFKIKTDHQSLRYLINQANLNHK